MKKVTPLVLGCIVLAGLSLSLPSTAAAAGKEQSRLEFLKREVARLSEQSGGEVGVAAELLGTGLGFSIDGDGSYPLASAYKVPMAAYAFHLIDQGKLSLDQMVPVKPNQVSLPGQPIATHFPHDGISLSLYNLIEVMLTQSDNTATDVVLTLIGGGKAVTKWLRKNGIKGMRVDRTTATLFREYIDIPAPKDSSISIKEQFDRLYAERGEAEVEEAFSKGYEKFEQDPQDHGTPRAMNELLKEIWRGDILSKDSAERLRGIMARCETGNNRIKGLLPKGTAVAHKTGTIDGTLNDTGVITLPGERGEIALTVFIKNSKNPDWKPRERAIADIARAVYDYYLFTQ